MQKVTPFLWFDRQAEEAATLYTSVFKNAKINSTTRYPASFPGDMAGKAMTVAFELDGQEFAALNGGPMFKFTEATSFVINCEDQREVDYYWDALTADGGQEGMCGWLKDKFGLSWQVVPKALPRLLSAGGDTAKAQRAMTAMMGMKKLVIAELERAAEDE